MTTLQNMTFEFGFLEKLHAGKTVCGHTFGQAVTEIRFCQSPLPFPTSPDSDVAMLARVYRGAIQANDLGRRLGQSQMRDVTIAANDHAFGVPDEFPFAL
jgi:hypothetical protein